MKGLVSIGMLLLFASSFTACKFTDKNPENEISSDMIDNPNSGYQEVDPDKLPTIDFEEMELDFGVITQGERVKKVYKFTNNGKSALVLSSVKAGCGCTVIDSWPREPIMPGEKGEIEIEFNSENKKGSITKTVTVVSNTNPSTKMVFLKGDILAPDTGQ